MARSTSLIPLEQIENQIYMIRGEKVILDSDLAQLYGVTTKRLNEQVKRNRERFPNDFMFQLSWEEAKLLLGWQNLKKNDGEEGDSRSQNATLKRGRHTKYRPYAFTEHGAIMAASVLNSKQAVAVSIFVVRAFVKLRQILSAHKELSDKLAQLEKKLQTHDKQIMGLFQAIKVLMTPPEPKKKKPIGYHTEAQP